MHLLFFVLSPLFHRLYSIAVSVRATYAVFSHARTPYFAPLAQSTKGLSHKSATALFC